MAKEKGEVTKKTITRKAFHIEFKNTSQALAWSAMEQSDVCFLLGVPGTAKTYLSSAYAVSEILAKRKQKIYLTRPMVEAGEKLGFLPGSVEDKTAPYFRPVMDCIDKLVGLDGVDRERINQRIEICPLAYLRGRTFDNSIAILDEGQNASRQQIILFLSRMGENTKMIITGDPKQSDLPGEVALVDIANRLESEQGVSIIHFNNSSIIRNPIIGRILDKLQA